MADTEVFAQELGGNPRVFESGQGYRLKFRYSTVNSNALTVLAKCAAWVGTPLIAYVAGSWLEPGTPYGWAWAILGFFFAVWFSNLIDLPIYPGRLTMDFTDTEIRWHGSGGKGAVHCTPDEAPRIEVRDDRVATLQEGRRLKKGVKGIPVVTPEVKQIVFSSGRYAQGWQKVASIYADDATMEAVHLVAAIRLLIETTAHRTLERHYGT